MENVRKTSNEGTKLSPKKYGAGQQNTKQYPQVEVNVQQGLCRWYNLLTSEFYQLSNDNSFFPEPNATHVYLSLKEELKNIPSLLMDELSNSNNLNDTGQYIRLVQVLLVNISDNLFCKANETELLCKETDRVLQFLQNFFYQYFDNNFRLPQFSIKQFKQELELKLVYWKIRLNESPLIDAIKEDLEDKMVAGEQALTFHQRDYLKTIFAKAESATSVLKETFLKELLQYYNFNFPSFIEFEIQTIRSKIKDDATCDQKIALLYDELHTTNNTKCKAIVCFELATPSVKQQISTWITQEIRNQELIKNKKPEKEFVLDSESRIQTSFSVAKLAVLIRLLVVDKIIINKSVAPMLRTVTKLFTTLQKDEISFGSLETKYHAPDKATLNTMKEMMLKWVGILGKL